MPDDTDSAGDIYRALQLALCLLVLFCIVGAIVSDAEWMLWVACGVTSLALVLWIVMITRNRGDTRIPTWLMPVPIGWHFKFYLEDSPVIGLDSHEPTVASGQGATLLAKYDDEIKLAPYVSNTFIWQSNVVPVDDESNKTTVTVYIGLDGQVPVEQTESWIAVRWHGSGDTWVCPPTVGADMELSNGMNDSDLLEIRVEGSESARAKFDVSGYRQLVAALPYPGDFRHEVIER